MHPATIKPEAELRSAQRHVPAFAGYSPGVNCSVRCRTWLVGLAASRHRNTTSISVRQRTDRARGAGYVHQADSEIRSLGRAGLS